MVGVLSDVYDGTLTSMLATVLSFCVRTDALVNVSSTMAFNLLAGVIFVVGMLAD